MLIIYKDRLRTGITSKKLGVYLPYIYNNYYSKTKNELNDYTNFLELH